MSGEKVTNFGMDREGNEEKGLIDWEKRGIWRPTDTD